jgi:hypothetical protein
VLLFDEDQSSVTLGVQLGRIILTAVTFLISALLHAAEKLILSAAASRSATPLWIR